MAFLNEEFYLWVVNTDANSEIRNSCTGYMALNYLQTSV